MGKEKLKKDTIKKIENMLEKYPFWLLKIETVGLGSPSNYKAIKSLECTVESVVENTVEYDEYVRNQIKLIDGIYDRLSNDEKILIRTRYFDDNEDIEDIIKIMNICKTKYYELRKSAFYKFALALGYIK
ncbi:MAG: hypothetical protein MJA82_15045 [Clostridia bacterium]|nr:hypothetical protein [Clostridia bacterium]